MNCEVFVLMDKHEQHVKCWLQLYETAENTSTAAEMGKYAIDLQKLKEIHRENCWLCRQNH